MLVLVEIKLEHNSVSAVGQLATRAREERALRVRSGAVAHHDLVPNCSRNSRSTTSLPSGISKRM